MFYKLKYSIKDYYTPKLKRKVKRVSGLLSDSIKRVEEQMENEVEGKEQK